MRRVLDAGLAAVIATVGLLELWLPLPSVIGEGSRAGATVVVILGAVLLALRRVWPLAVCLAILLLFPVAHLLGPVPILFWGQFVPMAVAVYSVARHGRGRAPLVGAAAAVATLLFISWRVPALQDTTEVFFHWVVFTLALAFGFGLSGMETRARESAQRALDVEVSATQQTMVALAVERARIARELHDVVAHSVSVMVVQAGAAREMVDDDTEYVRSALESIRSTGTGALSEMRRVLEVLRTDGEAGQLAPQPGAEGIGALVEETRRAGLDADLLVDGTPRALSPGLDLAAYRIVQEALTNVRRHASATRVRVAIHYAADHVAVEVRDDGVGVTPPSSLVAGQGLLGMRERTALYGGRLETSSGDGFTVRAVLPVPP